MATWGEVEAAVPDFARRVRELFDAGRHKTIATLRADGSPRISGIECEFVDGELRFGSMGGSAKGDDLLRDPRLAIHGPGVDPVEGREAEWPGEPKISGRAVQDGQVLDESSGGDAAEREPVGLSFSVDIDLVVLTHLDDAATLLVVESWTPKGGLRTVERA